MFEQDTITEDVEAYVDANGSVWRKTLGTVWVCDEIGQWVAPRPASLGEGEFGHLPARRVGARGMIVALASVNVENGYPIEVSSDAPGGAQGLRDGLIRLYAHEVDHAFADQLGNPHTRGSRERCFECGHDYFDPEMS